MQSGVNLRRFLCEKFFSQKAKRGFNSCKNRYIVLKYISSIRYFGFLCPVGIFLNFIYNFPQRPVFGAQGALKYG